MRRFLMNPMSPEQVEQRSFEIIDAEAPSHGFSEDEWTVVRRMIHASADFSLVNDIRFSSDAVDAAVHALSAGTPVFADANMIRAGLSAARLKRVNPRYDEKCIVCHVADSDVAEAAKAAGLPRSILAVRKAQKMLDGGIALFGNAPLALLELNRMIIEEGLRPALVAAMPVGFVHVVESKDEVMKLGVPYVSISGKRGGSALAVSALHALCSIAERKMRNKHAS